MVRSPWIDRLRVIAIAGVVVAHTATAYVVDVGWYYEERTDSDLTPVLFSFPTFLAALYGLAPLFVVAGWLAVLSVARHGPAGFARSRLLRLGVPAVVFLLFIDPVADWLGGFAVGETRSLSSYLLDPTGDRDFGPLWFVIALLVFSLGYAGWRRIRPLTAIDQTGVIRVAPLLAIGAGIAVGDLLIWQRWAYSTDTFWNLNWPHWPQAAGIFLLGVIAGQRGWFHTLPAGFVRRCGYLTIVGVAMLIILAALALEEGFFETVAGGWHWPTALFAVLDGFTAVALCVWLVGWFQTRWNGPTSPVTTRAARGSYAAYLVHPLILVTLSIAARSLPWPPEAKFLIVAAVGVPSCFAIGYLLTLVPGLKRVL